MRTQFDVINKSFTDKCHLIAQDKFYPVLFAAPRKNLDFVDTSLAVGDKEQILDGQMAVDRLVHVTSSALHNNYPLEFTVQERFRRPSYQGRQDVTITVWNYASNLPSELYKLNAGIFVYGYANDSYNPTDLLEAYAIDTTRVLYLLSINKIAHSIQKNKKNQSFIGIKMDTLRHTGCMMVEYYCAPVKKELYSYLSF